MLHTFKKIFKHITSFDIAFLVVGLLFLLGFYLFFRREIKPIIVTFKITDDIALYAKNNPSNEFAYGYLKGDIMKNELGKNIAEIVGINAFRVNAMDRQLYIDVKLRAVYNPRKNIYSLNGKNLIFGESFFLDFSKVKLRGLVVNFPGFEEALQTKHSKLFIKSQLREIARDFSDVYGVPDFVANSIHIGDKTTDSNGNTLAEIKDITIVPAKRTVISSSGQAFIIDDPQLKDVYLTIELTVKEISNEIFMFNYIPVKINTFIPLQLPDLEIYPVITEIIK